MDRKVSNVLDDDWSDCFLSDSESRIDDDDWDNLFDTDSPKEVSTKKKLDIPSEERSPFSCTRRFTSPVSLRFSQVSHSSSQKRDLPMEGPEASGKRDKKQKADGEELSFWNCTKPDLIQPSESSLLKSTALEKSSVSSAVFTSFIRRSLRASIDPSPQSKTAEECPVCLRSLSEPIGHLTGCNHVFCFSCILEWTRLKHSCPLCRCDFTNITVGSGADSKITAEKFQKLVDLSKLKKNKCYVIKPLEIVEEDVNVIEEDAPCMTCGAPDSQDLLLLCDRCDKGWHTYCVGLGTYVPEEQWFCDICWDNGDYIELVDHLPPGQRVDWREKRILERVKLKKKQEEIAISGFAPIDDSVCDAPSVDLSAFCMSEDDDV